MKNTKRKLNKFLKFAIYIGILLFAREVFIFLSPTIVLHPPKGKIISAYTIYDNFVDPEDYGAVYGNKVKSPAYSNPGKPLFFFYPLLQKKTGNNKLDLVWDIFPGFYKTREELLLLDVNDKERILIKKRSKTNYIYIYLNELYFFRMDIYINENGNILKKTVQRYPWNAKNQLTTVSTR